MSRRDGSPYRWRGFWLWPFDGYYDVHAGTLEPCSSSVLVEGLTLTEARAWIAETLDDPLRRLIASA